MSTPANFNGTRPVIDVNDAVMLLIDHQSGCSRPSAICQCQNCAPVRRRWQNRHPGEDPGKQTATQKYC